MQRHSCQELITAYAAPRIEAKLGYTVVAAGVTSSLEPGAGCSRTDVSSRRQKHQVMEQTAGSCPSCP